MAEARTRLRLHRARRRRGRARRAIRQGRLAGLRLRARPRCGSASPTRRRCSRASRWRSRTEIRREHGAALRPEALADTSGRSTRSAPPRRSGRTRVLALIEEPLDVMVVIGGYNSSNTCHLAALVQAKGVPHLPHRGRRRHGPGGGRRSATSRSAPRPRPRPRPGSATAASSASPPAPRRPTTRSARRSHASARWPASRRSCARRPGDPHRMTFVDLSHTIEHGMTTYPGLAGAAHLRLPQPRGLAGTVRPGRGVPHRQDRDGGEHRHLP